MPSLFPGMDPRIEDSRWADFHHGFVSVVQELLVPAVRPKYVVQVEKRVYVEQEFGGESSVIFPDALIARSREDRDASAAPLTTATTPFPVMVALPMSEERREAFLTVRDRGTMKVVTVIEVLSPGNKRPRSRGRTKYLKKRRAVLESKAHLVELDLLRGGRRLPMAEPLPPADYYALVCRSRRRKAEVYPWTLRQRMPAIPIPLAGDDPDATLDLQSAFTTVFDRAGYDYSLDYRGPIEPPLSEEDAAWAKEILDAAAKEPR